MRSLVSLMVLGLSLMFALGPMAFASSVAASSYIDYSVTTISTTTATNAFAGTTFGAVRMNIFDSSGLPIKVVLTSKTGAVINTIILPPGGDNYSINVPLGSYVQLYAQTTVPSSGINIITLTAIN